jgi:hypothetical protein
VYNLHIYALARALATRAGRGFLSTAAKKHGLKIESTKTEAAILYTKS